MTTPVAFTFDGAPVEFDEFENDGSGPDSGSNAGGADDTYDDNGVKHQAYGQAQPDVDERAPIPGGGELLEEPSDFRVFRDIDREVLRQEPLAKRREEEGKHWDRVRRGVPFSFLEKSEDQSIYRASLPPGIEDNQQPIPNKVLDLSSKQVSQILVDPPLPNPKPDGDSEENRGAMDLAKRFLRADGDASGTNDQELYREVLTQNRTRKSSFAFVWVDPTAGGWRPKQKKAHPRAEDPTRPLEAPMLDSNGQPITREDGSTAMERATDPVLRYVGEDEAGNETFVDQASEAAREWLPKHRRKVLTANQVRTLPSTAPAWEAHSITLIMWEPLGEARKRFSCLANMSKQQLKQLCTWKPKRWKSIVPEAQRPKGDGLDADGSVSDDTLLFWYHKFCRITPDYPDGAEIAVTGGTVGARKPGYVLKRDTLREDVELEDGTMVPVLMDPPIAQFRALLDAECGDPMGDTPVSFYGGANETRAHLYLSVLEDIELRLNPNVYLGATSSVTREDINRRDGTPIEILTKDDMPTFEQRPPMPAHLPTMLERVDHDMDVLANLSQTAQALDSSYSVSGEAKKVALRQAKVQLAQEWQGFVNGCVTYWRIKLQLAQARLKTPQLVKLGGENAAYKQRWFVGADLIGVSTVALQPGSATMMSPAEKAQYLSTMQQAEWLDKDQAGEVARTSMADDLGLPPNPHEEHIDRCIADWLEGPPEGWEEHFQEVQRFPERQQAHQQQLDAATKQTVAALVSQGADPETAQQLAAQQTTAQLGPAPVEPPPLPSPFEPRANDEEPVVAKVHYVKLSRLMSTVEFSKWPKSWRTLVEQRYQQAAFAAGVQTVRQQQEAQAQAAQEAAAAQQKHAPKDPNAPPFYEDFIAAATKAVVAKAQSLLAREAAALGEAAVIETKPAAEHAPAELGQDGEQPAEPVPTHPLDLAHKSDEAERDRAHERDMSQLEHAQTMEQINAKNVGARLAAADRRAARKAGQPTPAMPGRTDE